MVSSIATLSHNEVERIESMIELSKPPLEAKNIGGG
jgi:hypothetical protein